MVVAGLDKSPLSNINRVIDEWVANKKIPGASMAVLRRNQLVHESYHGVQDIVTQRPLTKETLFRIYSMTKPITSVALMMLYERGEFKMTDPVSLYIPSFDKRKLPGIYDYALNQDVAPKDVKLGDVKTKRMKSQIRVWQLLTHCSGLTYGFDQDGVAEPVDKLYVDNGCRTEKEMHSEPLFDAHSVGHRHHVRRLFLCAQPRTGDGLRCHGLLSLLGGAHGVVYRH